MPSREEEIIFRNRLGSTDTIDAEDLASIPQASVANLTHSVGTSDGTVADVGAAFNQTTLNNNFRDLSDKVNAILAALRSAGIISS